MIPLVAIVGPTAVGKTALALRLAQAFDAEIVGADSRQIYRYIDIGTAKPTAKQRRLVPHHLLNVADPDEDFSLALYQQMAYHAIEDIHRRGRTAFLVGGSGLYVRAVVEGFAIPEVAPHPELRRSLEGQAAREGAMALHRQLQRVDPAAADRIDPRNVRRVVRALEVWHATGTPVSVLQTKEPPYETLMVGLTTAREDLYRRIDERVDRMIEEGLIDEVQGLIDRGYSLDLPSLSGLGYREIGEYLDGSAELATVVQHIKHESHRFARHQYAWFRPGDESIRWFDVRGAVDDAVAGLVGKFLAASQKVTP